MPRRSDCQPELNVGPSGDSGKASVGHPARYPRLSRNRRGRGGGSRPSSREVYAAIDLGTNNCRLLIATPAEHGIRVVDAFSRIVRLGEGLSRHGVLSPAAMARTIDALKICAAKLERRRVTRLRAIATEACRRAANCSEFLERVRLETGIHLEIISNLEEANLALFGCAPLFDRSVPHALVFDIGGGSTEISFLDVAAFPGKGTTNGSPEVVRASAHSIPLGVVTLAERHGGHHVASETYETMVTEVLEAITPFETRHDLSALARSGDIQMLGTSGTVTTLAGVHKRLPRYDRSRVDGSFMDFSVVREVSDRIITMSYEERAAHPCIGEERADLVVAGCAVLEAICRCWPVGRLRVADRGLREGMLFLLMRELGEA